MAGGISPNKTLSIPLGDYNYDHYLTILYQAMLNLGWNIGYFDHDGIIAYTNISWASYSEEVSVRIIQDQAVIKSECVGYQGFFYDYGKNAKNLESLLIEIEYADFHLKEHLAETCQELMDAIPEKQFLNLKNPPMAGKEKLHSFFAPFIPTGKYFVTPILILVNIAVFLISLLALSVMIAIMSKHGQQFDDHDISVKMYLFMGFNNRSQVLSGQVWRLLSNTFLHFSVVHLVSNMIVLSYIGSLIESKLGRWNYLLLYLATGVCGSMASVIWRDAGVSAGASGAIFGLFGILLALLSTNFYERSARKALFISTIIFVSYNIIPTSEHVDHAAHFGGLISGYVFGLMAYMGLTHKNVLLQKWGIAVASTAAVLIFVSCSIAIAPQYNLKEYKELISRSENLSSRINNYFYRYYPGPRQQKVDSIEHGALPAIKILNTLAPRFDKLVLPSKKKKEAIIRAKLITLECRLYQLLYLEFKNDDRIQYRPELNRVTNQINALRAEWQFMND